MRHFNWNTMMKSLVNVVITIYNSHIMWDAIYEKMLFLFFPDGEIGAKINCENFPKW